MLVLLLNGMPLLFTQCLQEMLIGDYCFFPDLALFDQEATQLERVCRVLPNKQLW